jgi:hypothetical protein
MKLAVARLVLGLLVIALGALACRQSDSAPELKMAPSSPMPGAPDAPSN